MIEKIDTVVVGGGQAGLTMSCHVKPSGNGHARSPLQVGGEASVSMTMSGINSSKGMVYS
jgi:succinate dehydrogenase/fumarate reductase flavoprotein subunit